MSKPTIGFAGLTHLGLVSGAGAAEKGFEVVGYDPDGARVDGLRRGRLPVAEPGLDDLVARNRARLRFTDSAAELAGCDLVFIAEDVPTDDRGESDLAPIRSLIDRVSGAMRPGALLVVLCQVPPGFTRSLNRDAARTFYLVETLTFGQAVARTLRPERLIVGLADPARPLPAALRGYLESYGCPILPMRYESAELAKISINMFLVSSVTTANVLAELCETVGADWREIAPALRLDKRIGPDAYLAPGLGIAGGNLERDLATAVALGDANGTDVEVVRAWQSNSRYRKDWVLRKLPPELLSRRPPPRIAVLGLAYKKDTDSTKNSPALAVLAALRPFPIAAYDPAVAADPSWHPRLTRAGSALDACAGADAVLVMTPWDEFAKMDIRLLAKTMAGNVVLDPYGVLDGAGAVRAGLRYHRLGVAEASQPGKS